MTFDATALDGALKRMYTDKKIENLAYDANARPLLSMLEKDDTFAGTVMAQPVIYANGGAVGGNFAAVQSNARSSEIAKFLIDVGEIYGVATITQDAVDRARNDVGAFVNGLEHMMDTTLEHLSDRCEQHLWSDKYAALGEIGSIASNVITLADAASASKFYKGQQLVVAADTSTAPRSGTATVTAVDLDAGTVTIDSTPTGAAAGDQIFLEADYASAGESNGIYGIPAWIPSAAPSSGDSHFGVDRSSDPTRLAGTRASGSTSDVLGAIQDAADKVDRHFGKHFDHVFMGATPYRTLLSQVETNVRRTDGEAKTVVGTSEVVILGPKTEIVCHRATHLNATTMFGLRMQDWRLVSMLKAIRLMEQDGLRIMRQANAAGYEARWVSRPQPVCKAPGHSARITLS